MANVITQDDLGQGKNSQPGQGQLNQPGGSQGAQGGSAGGSGGGSAGGSAGGAGGAPQSPSGGGKQMGSGFTNIQKIIGANQGNQLNSTVAQGIQGVGQQTQQQLGQAQSQFQQGAQANQLNTQANQQLLQQGLANPTQLTGNPSNVSQFQNILAGKYQGPQGLANADQLTGQAQYAQQLGQQLGSQGGQQSLLQRFVGGNQYSQGQKNLDTLLMGAGPQNQLNQARQSVAGLGSQVNAGVTAAQNQAQQLGAQANQFGQAAQQQFGNTVNQQVQGLQQQAQTAASSRDQQYQKLLSGLQGGQISAEDAQKLGLTSGEQIYNTFQNPSSLVKESTLGATAQNVASSQDYARMQALQQLAGTNGPASAMQQLGQFAGQQGQAGAFQAAGTYNADPNAINQSIQSQAQAYQAAMNPLIQRQNDLYAYRQMVGNDSGMVGAPIANRLAADVSGYHGKMDTGFGGQRSSYFGGLTQGVQQQAQQEQANSGYGNVLNIAGQPTVAPAVNQQLAGYLNASNPWNVAIPGQ